MSRRDRQLMFAFGVVSALFLLALNLHPALTEATLYLAPAIALAVPLVAGLFPGERTIARIRERRTRRAPRRAAVALSIKPRAPRASFPRGGRLMAFSLAVRPPPAAFQL